MTAHFHTNILQNIAPQELNKHTYIYTGINYKASVVQPTHSPGHPIITRVAQKQVLKKKNNSKTSDGRIWSTAAGQ